MIVVNINSDYKKGIMKMEYEDTLELLNSLQNFLDNTETPSQALDNLYINIVESIKAINHEMENQDND